MRLLGERRHEEACQQILQQYGAQLHGFLSRSLLSADRADDLYQDLAVSILEGLATFSGRSTVLTWTYAIAHHLIKRWRRRYSRRHVERLDTDREGALAHPSVGAAGQGGLRDEVGQLLAQLGVTDREVLILRTERDLGYAEIGEILGITEDAAKKRFQRARTRLQELAASPAE